MRGSKFYFRSWTNSPALRPSELLDSLATRQGFPLPVMDGLITATARVHQLTLATRNTTDFRASDVPVFDPWDSSDVA
jgi:predicted nucleic acid-binding protein